MMLQSDESRSLAAGQVVGMPDATLAFRQPLSTSPSADLRLAASQRSGPKRRACEAEMPLQDCQGDPWQAATMFGWGRPMVEVGLTERRTGLSCLGAPSAFSGRHRWADTPPEVAAALRRRAEAHAQHDPTFRPTLASTRLTAQAALEAWRAQGYCQDPLPAPSTMAVVRHRMGFRLRTVVKAKPQKKMAETDAMCTNLAKKPTKPCQGTTSHACVSIVKPQWPLGMASEGAGRGAIPKRVTTTWACTRGTVHAGVWLQTARRGPAPWGVLPRPVRASSMRVQLGGQRGRRPSREPWRGGRAKWLMVQQGVVGAPSFCPAWGSVPTRVANPSICCLPHPSTATTIRLHGVGGLWNCPGMGRSGWRSRPCWHGPRV